MLIDAHQHRTISGRIGPILLCYLGIFSKATWDIKLKLIMNSIQKNSPFLNGTFTVDFTAEPLSTSFCKDPLFFRVMNKFCVSSCRYYLKSCWVNKKIFFLIIFPKNSSFLSIKKYPFKLATNEMLHYFISLHCILINVISVLIYRQSVFIIMCINIFFLLNEFFGIPARLFWKWDPCGNK